MPSPLGRLRRSCLALPDAWEKVSHGEPTFWVGKKMFATFANAANHHGAGRHAVWCKATHLTQDLLLARAPKRYFRAALRRPEWLDRNLPRRPSRLGGCRRATPACPRTGGASLLAPCEGALNLKASGAEFVFIPCADPLSDPQDSNPWLVQVQAGSHSCHPGSLGDISNDVESNDVEASSGGASCARRSLLLMRASKWTLIRCSGGELSPELSLRRAKTASPEPTRAKWPNRRAGLDPASWTPFDSCLCWHGEETGLRAQLSSVFGGGGKMFTSLHNSPSGGENAPQGIRRIPRSSQARPSPPAGGEPKFVEEYWRRRERREKRTNFRNKSDESGGGGGS